MIAHVPHYADLEQDIIIRSHLGSVKIREPIVVAHGPFAALDHGLTHLSGDSAPMRLAC